MARPLDGVRVLEHGTFITGPAASALLADLGADVIKVELPGSGDPFRAFKGGLYSPHYQTHNRNKRSLTLNTKKVQDLEVFDRLIREADVYLQNFRPGVAEQIGAGEARLRALNPQLIYCAISGFGADGPYVDRPSYDTVAQAYSGFLSQLVAPEVPRVVGPAIADLMTGFYAAYGVLAALFERKATGVARKVETSMMESMMHFNIDAFQQMFSANDILGPYDRARVSQSYVLKCADGLWLSLHMSSPDKFWQGLAKAMEREDVLQDVRFADRMARVTHHVELNEVLQQIFIARDRSTWCQRLLAEDVPHAPMYKVDEVIHDPQVEHLQMIVKSEHPTMGAFTTVRSPVSFDGVRHLEVKPPPTLGEDNADILAHGWGRPR